MKKLRKIISVFLALLFAFSTVYASDIDGHWAKDKIKAMVNKNIMSGYNGRFMPDNIITRGEFVVLVIRALGIDAIAGETEFSDVETGKYYTPYIKTAYEKGVISGFPDGTFRPKNPITREEAMIVLSRAFGFLAGYSVSRDFTDFYEVSSSAKNAMGYAIKKGIISGYPDKTLRPKGHLSRAEAAVIILGSMNLKATEPGFITGYPKISSRTEYGKIVVDIKTNIPATIYYMVADKSMLGTPSPDMLTQRLVNTDFAYGEVSKAIPAENGKEYNIYLVAKTPDGQVSNVMSIENVSPLPFKEGNGSISSPYAISTQAELKAIKHFPDKAFILKNDIALTGEWTPLGDFSGRLDGNGKAITNLYIDSDEGYQGLFSRILKGEIKNLTISGKVTAYNNAGLLAGEMLDARVINSVVSGYVCAKTNNAGGFFGENAGKIENCLSSVYLVEANAFAGGITGQNYGIIKNSISAAHTVTATMYAGSVSSVNMGGKIEGSAALSINVFDELLNVSGRVTTEKQNSVLSNNIAYEGMNTNQEYAMDDRDNQNGEGISWEDMVNPDRLSEILGWEENSFTGGGKDEKYLIMRPKGTKAPELIAGLTEYAPVRISNIPDFYNISENPNMHYILTADLTFQPKDDWKIVADTTDVEMGFSGTLDGNGHTIYGLSPRVEENGRSSMFGIISTGTVRNLNLSGVNHKNANVIASIAAENYGTVENCNVLDMDISLSGDTVSVGGLVGYNYGLIASSETTGEIYLNAKNATIGGIAAYNEGFIEDVAFRGKIETKREDEVSESIAGGIVGFMAAGSVYNAATNVNLRQSGTTVYQGGITGILSEGEIYKTSSLGSIIAEAPADLFSSSYSGGMTGLLSSGLVMHSFSDCDIKEYTAKSYGGGISGFSESGMIQQCYSTGSLLQTTDNPMSNEVKSYLGGIVGYNDMGTVYSTVSLNDSIITHGEAHRIIGGGDADSAYDNYTSAEDKNHTSNGAMSGKLLPKSKLDAEYFTMPVSVGGLIGWSDEVWQKSPNVRYTLPVLRQVRYQGMFN